MLPFDLVMAVIPLGPGFGFGEAGMGPAGISPFNPLCASVGALQGRGCLSWRVPILAVGFPNSVMDRRFGFGWDSPGL